MHNKMKGIIGYGTLAIIAYSMITHPIYTIIALALISTGITLIDKRRKQQ